MSAEWEGNLLNTLPDTCIDIAVLTLTVYASIPQINLLRASTSTQGLSASYVLFGVLISSAQLSENLLCAAFAWPNASRPVLQEVWEGRLRGFKALGGLLGHVQILVQWGCEVAVLVAFAATESQAGGWSGSFVSVLAFLHAALVVFPAVYFCKPPWGERSMGRGILVAMVLFANTYAAPVFVLFRFVGQLWEMSSRNGVPGALNLLSLGLQALAFAALAFRWFLRAGAIPWLRDPDTPRIYYWLDRHIYYQWGFTFVNYGSQALGCAVLLVCYKFGAWGGSGEGPGLQN